MINYCQDKGVRLFVGHVLRFFPEYVKAKSLLDQGDRQTRCHPGRQGRRLSCGLEPLVQ